MDKLATLFRAGQFYAHAAHNFTKGPTFFEDHEFLGELYGTYEDAYDGLVERMIGTGEPFDVRVILTNAAAEANKYADPQAFSPAVLFGVLQDFEKKFRAEIDAISDSQSIGTQNLLADLADKSEARSYKIGQRLKA